MSRPMKNRLLPPPERSHPMKNLSACLQTLFPKKHVAVQLFNGFCLSLAYLLPHPYWVSRDTLLVILGVYVALLCVLTLILYLTHSEILFLPSSGWVALSHAGSGLLFLALSGIDWLVFDNPPMLAILIGTGILLVQFVYTFIKIRQGEDVE